MSDDLHPRYLTTLQRGAFDQKTGQAYRMLEACCVCPRHCGANRLEDHRGACRSGVLPLVSSFHAHFGEEAPLSGQRGSGTIFFANCNLRCTYCQNYDISQHGAGAPRTCDELASMMLILQEAGCHNINLVTPSHFVPQIIKAIHRAAQQGLSVPIVYNTSSYDSLASLAILDGIIDIYLADLKYGEDDLALRYSNATSYVEVSQNAVKEMFRQVGDLKVDADGVAQRGLMIRHLVLPGGIAGTERVMRFLAQQISPCTYVNLMSQYRPCYLADQFPALNRRITRKELEEARHIAQRFGLTRSKLQNL